MGVLARQRLSDQRKRKQLLGNHTPMGQRAAKQNMQAGVRLYHQRHHATAINKWRNALNKLNNAEDRFITLGYLAQAFCDAADYEGMLQYALQQMELANDKKDDYMKSEAFLNLAKAYEKLADFSKALSYGKASLQHPSMDSRTPGYAHFTMAMAHLGFSQFQNSLEEFEASMNIANETGDRLLELQICVGLGSLFTLLRDITKALIFLRNALAIVQSVSVEDVHAKYRCLILYHLSVALRIKGNLVDAKDACDEATQLAIEIGNRSLEGRCMCSLADIYRELGESEAKETITKSWARYEEAFRMMRAASDRMGELIVLSRMAKSASESRSHYTGQCECQAIQLNKKCLEISKSLGCKYVMLKCHLRLADLYSQLNDDDSEEAARTAVSQLTQQMQLFCNFCGQRFATKDASLQALRCSHIFHERCLHTFLLEREDQTCPKCKCRAVATTGISDAISMRTPSICSTADLQSPSTSAFPKGPPGGVRTPLVDVASSSQDKSRIARYRWETEEAINRLDSAIDKMTSSQSQPQPEAGPSTSHAHCNNKPAPPIRKPSCSTVS
ncbi:hypothetical protein WR25_20262 isoform D [Diploscapter pachys]|uniref:RING-type domain-containing protein n=1 Tax=Diploscapter pachys TaxID=2018661 RepID=A0A2A2LPD5_9BILA|nr:hypothetical protein WR25_20262 isoform D [Diploscapter pachys]